MAGGREDTGRRAVRRRLWELGVRRWQVSTVAVLLLAEGAGLSISGFLGLTAPEIGIPLSALEPWETPIRGGLLLLGGLALVAAAGLLRLWPVAWLLAMGLQGVSLAAALVLYFYLSETPGQLYAEMAYLIIMVFYLNSHRVRTAFQTRPMGGEEL